MATKKNSEYWATRFNQVEQAANNKTVKYSKQLEKKYKMASKEIDTKINSWYQRIAVNNEITVEEARRLLSKNELAEFKWDVQQYIEAGRQNAIDERWIKELENASAKFHINRLEALKMEVRQQIELAMAGGQQSMFDTLADVYKDSFYRSCFEIQKGYGVGFDVSALDDGYVQRLLNKPWSVDGENFSKKLWGNKTKLINTLDQELTKMVLTGASPQKAIQNIQKTMNTSLFNAKRLVFTEQAYFSTLGQKDAFGELDVEEFEVVATLDSATSEVCQQMDGKHFPLKDMQPGVNAPPFHPFCRSTTCPYFDDEFTLTDKRVAKNEQTGEWYEVPSNMTYPEWKKSFVDGGSKTDLTPIPKTPEVEIITDAKDFSEYDSAKLQEWEKSYYETNNKVSLTDNETKALDDYGEGLYEAINAVERFDEDSDEYKKVLRKYGAEEMEKAKEATEHLNSAINKFDLDEDIVVHRAVRDASYITGSDNSIEALQDMVGKTYTDKGYVSTSLQYQSKFTGMKDDAVHLEITVPKGSNGALIDDYVAKDEYEFLINRNQQFTVVEAGERVVQVQKYDFKTRQYVTVDKKERYMKVQLLPDEALAKKAKSGTMNTRKGNVAVAKDTKDFDELSNYLDSTYGIKMDDSVKKLNFDIVRDSIDGVETVIAEYPEVGVLLQKTSITNSGVMSCTNDTLSFNPTYFDSDYVLDLCDQLSTSGFWVQNSSPMSIGVHEAAHGVEWALIQTNPSYTYDFERIIAWNKCTEAKAIVKEAIAEVKKTAYGKGKKKADLIKAISDYANDTASETMAEAFADVAANGANANPLSIEIKKATMKRYTQYKGGGTP